jgi:hypothetical protein
MPYYPAEGTLLLHLALVLAIASPETAILSVQPYTAPAYAAIRGIENYATGPEYNRATSDPAITIEKITYSSDGLKGAVGS